MSNAAPRASEELTRLAVHTLKFLAIDAIEAANSGHPGLPMGAADLAFVLWSRFLKHDPRDPKWADRDRFVLSPGHGSMLLYGLLHLSGYALSLDELKHFRQWGSLTPGHPEHHLTPGVEVTTGPLGQGFANGVGLALAAKMAEARYPGLYNHRIWAIVSDGDVMEGISHEAASLAGHLQLGNLIFVYDDNKITLDGALDDSMSESVPKRFEAYGWHVQSIDGHDHEAIANAYEAALAETTRPSLICARTHIGNGAPNKHDTHKVHGEPLGKAEVEATRKALGWPLDQTFVVPPEVKALWDARAAELGRTHDEWKAHEQAWLAAHPELAETHRRTSTRAVPADLFEQLLAVAPKAADATRALAGIIEQKAAELVPSLVGGDADLGGSTKTPIKGSAPVAHGAFSGRNIRFGIREHAMGAIANGMSSYGHFIPFTATFLTFSDYMRPAIRIAALTETQAVHVFTHDSIFLGEDGPTHQSVEHVASLRLIPNVHVWRPASAAECAAAWASALQHAHGPTEIVLSRQKVADLPAQTDVSQAVRGAYIAQRETGDSGPEVTVIATGSEVGVALEAAATLSAEGRRVRVVSMPCCEVFAAQPTDYRDAVLPRAGRRVSIEAGRTELWRAWVGLDGLTLGVDRFGASAPAKVLAEKYELTGPQVTDKIRRFLG